MPLHETHRLEYAIESGYIAIMLGSRAASAYWAHPRLGQKFAGVCLLHDWWGLTPVMRLLANYLAQTGYYVIVPDLFERQTASTPKEALALMEHTRLDRPYLVNAAISAIEHHHMTTSKTAVIGVGMGGTLAFGAAIERHDVEAVIACGGFPQAYLGQFTRASAPILALYGEQEPFVKPIVQAALRAELAATPLAERHRLAQVAGAGHEFFFDSNTAEQRAITRNALEQMMHFLDSYIERPKRAQGGVY